MKRSLSTSVTSQADLIGMLAATLCMIHCLVTPLFFVAKPFLLPIEESKVAHPSGWWELLDYVFLTIGLLAVVFTTRASSPRWLVLGLWASWFCLAVGIHLEDQILGKFLLYGGSVILILHHVLHYKFCHVDQVGSTHAILD